MKSVSTSRSQLHKTTITVEEDSALEEKANELTWARKQMKQSEGWTHAEINALEEGYSKYGAQWLTILHKNKDTFDSKRTKNSLANKYALMHKTTSYYTSPLREWVLLDNDGRIKRDDTGEEVEGIMQKFPYDAAKQFIKRMDMHKVDQYIFTLAQKDEMSNTHEYIYTPYGEKPRLRKLKRDGSA